MSTSIENVIVLDATTSLPSTSVDLKAKSNLEISPEDDQQNFLMTPDSMDTRTNASTDDLIFLDSGNQTPDEAHTNMNAANSTTSLESTEPVPPSPTKKSSIRRKTRNTLRLNLDENTWTSQDGQSKSPATAKFRQNLQAGAARVSAVVQKGKTPEFRFRLILIVLFGSIVGLVAFTWYLYEKHVIQLSVVDKIRFHEVKKVVHLLKADGEEILNVDVGMHIPNELRPFNCELLYPTKEANICAEWKYRARLRITFSHNEIMSCYTINWKSLSPTTTLKDCIHLDDAHWYGMGEVKNISWPLSGISERPQPFVTGDLDRYDFGGILERYWLSSEGVAITVAPDIPLYISLNNTGKNDLCFESKYDSFPYNNDKSELHLNYTICTGLDMREVHKGMWKKNFQPTNISMDFLNLPIWSTAPKLESSLTQGSLLDYANHIMDHGFPAGFILIDTKWQEVEGELKFNPHIFPDPPEILNILKIKGFKTLLAIHPYVCLGADIFPNATEGRYLVSDEKQQVPLLTRWKNEVCAIIDITRNASQQWLYDRIMQVKTDYPVLGFLFVGGQSSFLPPYYSFHNMMVNPDNVLSLYLKIASGTNRSYLGVSVGFQSQHISAFVRLAPRTSTWDATTGLKSIIPAVLTLGLLGYPLVNPGSVGGDVFPSPNVTRPEKELYIRWLQLAAFMPVIQLSVPPGEYDLDVIKAAKFMFKVRVERIMQPTQSNEYIKRVINEYYATGAPLIRPLWWLAPKDPNAQVIDSQFAVGNDLIVAPVLDEGQRSRDVYLPPGRWRDELFGMSRLGGKWIYNYSVPLDKVAYFIKNED